MVTAVWHFLPKGPHLVTTPGPYAVLGSVCLSAARTLEAFKATADLVLGPGPGVGDTGLGGNADS